HGMPAIDEALGQPVMQRIRQAILYRPAALLPVDGILEPERTVGDEGPGPDMGDASDQRVDVAFDAVQAGDLRRHPVGRQPAVDGEMTEDLAEQPDMGIAQDLAE